MMAKYETAWAAKINGNAYRDLLRNNPDRMYITLTRPQMEVIIRDLCEYTDRDAEATAWAEQATRSAARIAELEEELLVARGMAIVRKVIADLDARDARSEAADGKKREVC